MAEVKNAPAATNGDSPQGFLYALTAYVLWGFLPFFMKAVAHIPASEVVAHRILWSVPLAGLVLVILGRTADIRVALRSPRMLAMAALTAVLITINWGIYVWAIAAGRAIETALGYYINPLFSIFLGAVLLKEKLTRAQIVAIVLAAAAVAVLAIDAGGLPWVSLALCISWGFYAFFRKTLPIGPNQGFFLEVLLLSIPAIGYIIWLETTGRGHFGDTGTADVLWLLSCGVVTAVPLILFASAARRLRLSTLGFLQYIAPTCQFLLAVFRFGEPFTKWDLISFALIWSALLIYTIDSLLAYRTRGLRAPTFAARSAQPIHDGAEPTA